MLDLEQVALATGGTLVKADDKMPKKSSLKTSQFKRTVKELRKIGYMFPKDELYYHSMPGSDIGYTFPFTNGMDSYGLHVISNNGDYIVTVGLSMQKQILKETVRFKAEGDLDTSIASRVRALMAKLNAKAQA